jgi:ComF family protein
LKNVFSLDQTPYFTGMVKEGIRAVTRAGLGLIYPETCQICKAERAPAANGFVGSKCWSQVRFIRPPFCQRCGLPYEGDITTQFVCTNCRDLEFHFAFARSATVAKTVVLEAIHRFKYSQAFWFENFLADLLLREAIPALAEQKWDLIVPVPLHPLKLREREFNQAEHLASCLSRAANLPLDAKSLRRVHATATQTLLNREQRASNMQGAFNVTSSKNISEKRIILVDDVFTTGATTNACAAALRRAGASAVGVWTVARGL